MTSRQLYWCSNTMKRRPYWCFKQILHELDYFPMQPLSFTPELCIDDGHVIEIALFRIADHVHMKSAPSPG